MSIERSLGKYAASCVPCGWRRMFTWLGEARIADHRHLTSADHLQAIQPAAPAARPAAPAARPAAPAARPASPPLPAGARQSGAAAAAPGPAPATASTSPSPTLPGAPAA